ncbi:MAG: 50S ribosomal protein L29 [Phycisphaerales bacterium]|nr:MAG: 50S ribosomal protein L29 [Phycisphaerales bacterium]
MKKKKLKIKELRKLSEEELLIEAERLRKKHFELRAQAVTEKITDTSQFKKLRQELARVLTLQNQKAAKA